MFTAPLSCRNHIGYHPGTGVCPLWVCLHCSVSLIECGPVNTNFLNNVQCSDLEESSLQCVDPETRDLYERYLQHCQTIFQDVAQDTEDVLQVFMDVIHAPCPSLRYFTTQFFMPLMKLKLSCTNGSEYVRAMHKFVFASKDDKP